MHRIDFHNEAGDSIIAVGESLKNVGSYLPEGRLYIITDNNIRSLYKDKFPAGVVLEIPSGEASKTISVVEELCLKLSNAGADRQSFILGIGGGVVCDITGLVASLYMRGVRHGFVSASLLSQVDASVGGKTGVNAGRLKNVIGTFKLPEFVICDLSMLATLPQAEFVSGIGELIKSAIIADRELFFDIKQNIEQIMLRNDGILEDLIFRSLKIKTAVVSEDYKESGQRRMLNFGHTMGHALEMLNNTPHGVAVMQGMILAAKWSVMKGYLAGSEYLELKYITDYLKVPAITSFPKGFIELVQGDKKRSGSIISFVFLQTIGQVKIEKVTVEEITNFIATNPDNGLLYN